MILAVSMLLVAQVAFSQNITLKFTGATYDGRFARLDSVQVQNVSRSWSETVVYPDTVLIFQQTGIVDAQGSTADIASYPNPFNGTTNVVVTMLQSGDATLQVYNLAGQCVAERTMTLQAGKNLFEVRLQTAQVYLLAVTTAEGRSTVKLLNRGTGSENSISYYGNSNIVEKRLSTHIFHSGDVLKITGYVTNNGAVVASREVLQPQTASENFTLFFTLPVAPVAPTVTTTSASNVTTTTATSGGNVTSDGGSAVTTRGVCWSTSQNPTLSDSHTSDGSGTGSFTSNITGLTAGITYYVRAYAINSVDTAYGNQITFTTSAVAPTVTTTAASSITSTTATSGGNVTSDGGSAVTARGLCWSTSQNPTLSNSHTTDGSGTGSFTSNLMGLTAGTTYYVRAYAINSVDTTYGNQITFITTAVAPTLTTTTASNITSTAATSGGNVTSDGGAAITTRGVCWSTSQNPTLSNSHTTDGSGTGSFTSNLMGLTAGTTYYVRAYAINSVDTTYGNQITFTTTAVAPIVTTIMATNITDSSATSGGNVTSDGGSAVTARGVCWSTSQNPTLSNSHTTDGSGIGNFTSIITGLTPDTTYYVRAYAINSIDTAYGNQITFIHPSGPFSFSVSANSSVFFSPGNLQWSAKNGGSTDTTHTVAGGGTAAGIWRFAPNQWDVIGNANSNISSSYSGWIDLFGWGTSGYNNKYPYMTSTTNSDYGNGYTNISGRNYDWGVYNAIYNSKTSTTDAPGTWRTLTKDEWVYLLNTRRTISGIRYALAIVNGVSGLIIVPDNWSVSTYALNHVNNPIVSFAENNITSAQWSVLEDAGATFLPAAGYRNGTSVRSGDGRYWSATYYVDDSYASSLHFNSGSNWLLDLGFGWSRYSGHSVRLVKDTNSGQIAQSPTVTTATASNITSTTATTGGNVTSDGGSTVTDRGVCWSTSPNPTISDNITTNGTDTGSFTSNITGLTTETTYYARAFATNAAGTGYGNQITFTTNIAVFSVSASTRVSFSSGNLQWSATNGGSTATTHAVAGGGTAAGTWRFAPNQWDTIGSANNYISSSYSGWIDLFGWGTSGYNSKYPYMTSTANSNYGNGANSISNTYYDWGVYNAIYNSKTSTIDSPGIWRTLTTAEWEYLVSTRNTTSGIRYAKATINGVQGLIIVPDNWNTATYALRSTNTTNAAYTTNVISLATWTTLENAGCAFLPVAGIRNNISLYPDEGCYWSATYDGSDYAYSLYCEYVSAFPAGRYYGQSVRLVKDIPWPTVTTDTVRNITDSTAVCGGNVTNDGGYAVTARGVCWSTSQNPTLNGNHTSDSAGTGNFISCITGLNAGTTYYVRAYATNAAGTAYGNQITFTTTIPNKAFSTAVGSYVYFAPGNLQWSATNGGSTPTTHAVSSGGTAAGTWRFAPNQWDTIGSANSNISSLYSGWIDLFGWGTSGYHDSGDQYNTNYQPYSTSDSIVNTTYNYYGYGPSTNTANTNISGTYYDWGFYNTIYNPKTNTSDAPGTWRTLTYGEWWYLIDTRSTTSGIRYAKATVNGVPGLVLVPDIWSTSTYALSDTNDLWAAYTTNVISAVQWTTLENAGAIFLPAAGVRYGTSVRYVGDVGKYWSVSSSSEYTYDSYDAFSMNFDYYMTSYRFDNRYIGQSVRLVRNVR